MRNVSASRPWPVRSTCWRDQARAGGDDLRRLRRRHVLAHRRRRDAERRELLDEPQRALAVGLLVDAVQRRHAALGQQPRDLLVGRDHEVLDEPVRLGLLARAATRRRARRRRSETPARTSRARAPTAHRRRSCSAAETRAGRGERRRPRLERRLVAGEDPVDALVVQARVGADRRAVERRAHDVGARRSRARRSPPRARSPRHERAGVVGQRLGQHRLDAAGDVDARPAPRRLAVDERAGRDERADVGDVHPDARRAVVERLGGDRVVEVARGDGVDRERRQAR